MGEEDCRMTPILTPEPELVQTIREAVEAHKARSRAGQFARLADMARNLPPPTDAEVEAYLDRVRQGVR